ncbi:MAG: rRNA maturation RNase YbeY [Limisphaerales bacterium]
MNLILANRQRVKKLNLRVLKSIMAAVLKELKITSAAVEVNFLGAEDMAALNETFLAHEGPTDVITFDYGSSPSELKGEIFVCVEEAIIGSKLFKTSWQSEIVRYMIHGLLHLRGDDDTIPARRRAMKRHEGRLLRQVSTKFSLAQIAGAPKLRA